MSRDFIDYYAELGINPGISPEDLKKAWREFARIHHPDNGGDGEMFKRGEAAHSILKDPSKRSRYDISYRAYFDVGDPTEAREKERERTNAQWKKRETGADEQERKQRAQKSQQEQQQRAKEERERSERAAREGATREAREQEARRRADDMFRDRQRQEEERLAEEARQAADESDAAWEKEMQESRLRREQERDVAKEKEKRDIEEGNAEIQTKLKHPATTLRNRLKPKVVPESYWLREKEKANLTRQEGPTQPTGGENKG